MTKDISNKTIMVLTIVAIVISVLSITLSMIAVNKVSTTPGPAGGQQPIPAGGTASVDVPPQPSEMGAQVSTTVVQNP